LKPTFEERYELDKPFVVSFAFPWLYDHGILGVCCHMLRMCIELHVYTTSAKRG
jgi:hypothetical protein